MVGDEVFEGFAVDGLNVSDLTEISSALAGFDRRAFCGLNDSVIDPGEANCGEILPAGGGEQGGLGESVDRHDR